MVSIYEGCVYASSRTIDLCRGKVTFECEPHESVRREFINGCFTLGAPRPAALHQSMDERRRSDVCRVATRGAPDVNPAQGPLGSLLQEERDPPAAYLQDRLQNSPDEPAACSRGGRGRYRPRDAVRNQGCVRRLKGEVQHGLNLQTCGTPIARSVAQIAKLALNLH